MMCAEFNQWLFIELLQKGSHPCPQAPGCNCSDPFLAHTPLGEADENQAQKYTTTNRMLHPSLNGSWIVGSESN